MIFEYKELIFNTGRRRRNKKSCYLHPGQPEVEVVERLAEDLGNEDAVELVDQELCSVHQVGHVPVPLLPEDVVHSEKDLTGSLPTMGRRMVGRRDGWSKEVSISQCRGSRGVI